MLREHPAVCASDMSGPRHPRKGTPRLSRKVADGPRSRPPSLPHKRLLARFDDLEPTRAANFVETPSRESRHTALSDYSQSLR